MGSLVVPHGGTVYLDSQIIVYTVENHPRYAAALRPLWTAVSSGSVGVLTSELTLLETLVVPLRLGDSELVADFHRVWQQPGTDLMPITRDVLMQAAALRAELPSLRTPDAIHCATARLCACSMFLTNDRALQRVSDIPVVVLDDVN